MTPVEVRSAAQWWTYRSTKARRELGWTTRPHEETVETTVNWHREREAGRLARVGTRQGLGWRLAGFTVRRIGELVP